jgi:hypothetical protein
MIATDEYLAQGAALIDDLIRTCAISDNVAEIDNGVARRRGRKARIQGLQVAVNVTKKKNAHEAPVNWGL